MSDEVLAPILTIVLLAGLILWVPTLHLCNARCQRILRWRVNRASKTAAHDGASEQASR